VILGKVIGSLVSNVKVDCYNGRKLLLVRGMSPEGELQSSCYVAVDTVGAGKGDIVMVAMEGRSATEILELKRRSALRSVIVGIVDKVNLEKSSGTAKKESAA
jgi:microcompartment protein CcmK/EutM